MANIADKKSQVSNAQNKINPQAFNLAIIISWGKQSKALLPLTQFLATETPSKIMNNAFRFTLKALFVPKINKYLSLLFSLCSRAAW